jgi:hypothetical protein
MAMLNDTQLVAFVTNSVICHEYGKDRFVITTKIINETTIERRVSTKTYYTNETQNTLKQECLPVFRLRQISLMAMLSPV